MSSGFSSNERESKNCKAKHNKSLQLRSFFLTALCPVGRVHPQLEEYCGLDTIGMAWIVDALRRLAER